MISKLQDVGQLSVRQGAYELITPCLFVLHRINVANRLGLSHKNQCYAGQTLGQRLRF